MIVLYHSPLKYAAATPHNGGAGGLGVECVNCLEWLAVITHDAHCHAVNLVAINKQLPFLSSSIAYEVSQHELVRLVNQII